MHGFELGSLNFVRNPSLSVSLIQVIWIGPAKLWFVRIGDTI
jgi:hypothetical protein